MKAAPVSPDPARKSLTGVLLAPAVGLMNRLTYREKFLLISVLFAAPLAIAMHLLFAELEARSELTRQQTLGTRYLRPLMKTLRHVGEARLAARALADGEPDAGARLRDAVAIVDGDLEHVAKIDEAIGATLRTSDALSELRSHWSRLGEELGRPAPLLDDARFSEVLSGVEALTSVVGDHLILDPDLDTYDLTDLILLKLPEGQALLMQAAHRAAAVAARQPRTDADREELLALSDGIQANVNATRRRMEVAFRKDPSGAIAAALARPYDELVSSVNEYLMRFNRAVVYAPSIVVPTADVVAMATKPRNASSQAWDRTADVLDRLVAARVREVERRQDVAALAALVMLVVVAFLWFGFYRAVLHTVGRLELAALQMLRGEDPAAAIALEARDELALVVESFNAISKRLRREWEQAEEEKARALAAEAQLRQSERGLQSALAAAESASEAKSRFLASMSHELRTPLNSVIGFSNVLLKRKGKDLRDQDVTYLERIVANGEHLLGIINSILDLSKIEAEKMEAHITSIDLGTLVRDTAAQLEGRAMGRPVDLVVEVPAELAPIDSDADKLRQVLINLIGNALKFTERGQVVVRVTTRGAGPVPWCIEVSDTGPGIAEDMREAIFEAFRQADTGTARKYEGTGLGLAISRSLCKLMGHRIELDSEVGEGSTFRIVLGPAATSLRPARSLHPPRNAPSNERIVVEVRPMLLGLIPGFLDNRRRDVVRLEAALSAGDFDTIRSTGHDLKGTGAGYGFERITDIGRDLEAAACARAADDVRRELSALADYLDRVDIRPGT